jgi:hypothetical protein
MFHKLFKTHIHYIFDQNGLGYFTRNPRIIAFFYDHIRVY